MENNRAIVPEIYSTKEEIRKIIDDYLAEAGVLSIDYETFAEEQKKTDSITEQTFF